MDDVCDLFANEISVHREVQFWIFSNLMEYDWVEVLFISLKHAGIPIGSKNFFLVWQNRHRVFKMDTDALKRVSIWTPSKAFQFERLETRFNSRFEEWRKRGEASSRFIVCFILKCWQGARAYFRIKNHDFSWLFMTKHDDFSWLFNFSKKSYRLLRKNFFGKVKK